jgi:hypothetical protein
VLTEATSDPLGHAAAQAGEPATGRLRALAAKPPLVLGAIVLVAASVAAVFSLQVVEFEPDEIGYTHLAIGIARSLSPFTTSYGGAQRLNQLYPLLIAPIWGLFNNVDAFRITHAWNALLMASAAIPAYLLAREVVQRRWAAYLAAALVAAAPWLTISTSQLTEVAAYPACAWALLAMQRSLAVPSWRRDLLALLAIGVATYGRLQLILLAPVLVIAMLLHELGYGLAGGGGRRARLREAAGRMARGHTLLTGAGLLGLLIGVPLLLSGALASAFGFYGDTLSGVALGGATFDLARSYISFMALGLGALPVALAIGFACDTLAAPVSRTAHAFGSLTIVTVLALTLQVAEVSVRFNGSTLQERYSFYIVPLLVVGMCAALLLSRNPARTALVGSLVLAALVATTRYQTERTAFWYQVSPGLTSFFDWVRPAFGASSAPSANPGASPQVLAGLIVLALGVLLAALARRLSAARLLAGVATLAILFCAVETVHALWRVIHGNASGKGFGGAGISDADWVDRAVPGGAAAQQLVGSVGALGEARALWERDDLWNRSLTGAYTFESFSDPYLATTSLSVEQRSGIVTFGGGSGGRGAGPNNAGAGGAGANNVGAGNGGANESAAGALAPTPRYLVVPTRGFPVALQGSVLARAPGGKLQLLRPTMPLQAAWTLSGVSGDGWLQLHRPASLRLYALRSAPGRCATVELTVTLSSLTGSGRELRLLGHGIERNVPLSPGATRTLHTRVCANRGEAPLLRILNEQSPAATNPQLTPQLQRVTVTGA